MLHQSCVYLGSLVAIAALLWQCFKPPPPIAATATPEELVRIRAQMLAIYRKHKPENASKDKVDEVIASWKGRENEILDALRDKYGNNEEEEEEEEKAEHSGEEGFEVVHSNEASPVFSETKKEK
jgi:hypothetical protein